MQPNKPLKIDNAGVDRDFWNDIDYEKYIAGGRDPVPEDTYHINSQAFADGTIKRVMATEGPYSYYGHRQVWREMHKDQVYKIPKMLKAFGGELKEWWRFKTGQSPQGTDVPSGCDEAGNIVKPKGPCIVIGSGPSLDKSMPFLKDWKGGLISSYNAQTSTLAYHGVTPTHIFTFDSMAKMHKIKNIPVDHKKTILITHPGMNPELTRMWRGQKYWYKIYTPNSVFYSELIRTAYDFIHTTHFPFSCAISDMTAFAHCMGYDPIIYCGCDFAFTETQGRFSEHIRFTDGKGKHTWKTTTPQPPKALKKGSIILKANTGHLTQFIHLYYSRTTMAVYWLDTPNIISCSDGLLNGLLPEGDIEEIVKTQGKCITPDMLKTRDEIRAWIEPWLAAKGSFYIRMHDGHKLIECKNWETDIPVLLRMMHQQDPTVDVDAAFSHVMDMIEESTKLDYGPNKITVPTPDGEGVRFPGESYNEGEARAFKKANGTLLRAQPVGSAGEEEAEPGGEKGDG